MKEFCLAVKFLTNTFQPLWQSKNGFKVKNMGNHVVLFTFNNKNWVERILLSEPLSFDKQLMVLQRYEKDSNVHDMNFKLETF